MRNLFVLAVVLAADAPAATPDLAGRAQSSFERRGFTGALIARDVRSGRIVASVTVGDGARELPLSAAKLLLVASYFEHRRELPPTIEPAIDEIIAQGRDEPGRQLAVALRRALGSATLLRDLRRFGFGPCAARNSNCTTLSSRTSDRSWADTMSLGEEGFRVTPAGMSRFLSAVGRGGGGLMRAETATALSSAMLRTVEIGTARRLKSGLSGMGRLGGKTGTGPAGVEPHDGLFAGLVFDQTGKARYAVVAYVRRGGFGAGVAADIANETAASLLASADR